LHFFERGELYRDPEVPGRMETLRRRCVIHGGYLEIQENGQDREGWNLVLVRQPDSTYGDTWPVLNATSAPRLAVMRWERTSESTMLCSRYLLAFLGPKERHSSASSRRSATVTRVRATARAACLASLPCS
jgi:hypothetical protein